MRFSIAVIAAATVAVLLVGGIAVASAADATPLPRPVGFSDPMPPTHLR